MEDLNLTCTSYFCCVLPLRLCSYLSENTDVQYTELLELDMMGSVSPCQLILVDACFLYMLIDNRILMQYGGHPDVLSLEIVVYP